MFMAQVVVQLGRGGQRWAERMLGWNRGTVRKGQEELERGEAYPSRWSQCGRKRAEYWLPSLLDDICTVVEPTGQADPTFRSPRVYTPLTAREVRNRLVERHGYREAELPCIRTISARLAELGYRPQRVKKCRPLKKIPETDAIFEQVHSVNEAADADPQTLRVSLDAKAVVKVGGFSRGGKSRHVVKAYDHDFQPDQTLTPFGMLLPQSGESFLWFTPSKVTADFMVDRLEEVWPRLKAHYEPSRLVLNADNGPESNGHRTQWLNRLVGFSEREGITIDLAYYPPYHSKYNPVERCWGVLENHWRGELLETVEKTLGLARSMTYRGVKPLVKMVKKVYKTGVALNKKAMLKVEERLDRNAELPSWFITISPR